MELFGWLRKKKERQEQSAVQLEKPIVEKSEGSGSHDNATVQFAEIISRLAVIQEQMAKEKSVSDASLKFDSNMNNLYVFMQREFEKMEIKDKERVIEKSEKLLVQRKGEILREKISQSLKDQRLTFTELDGKISKDSGISFSRGLFSQTLQKLINENMVGKEDCKYFLKESSGQFQTDD